MLWKIQDRRQIKNTQTKYNSGKQTTQNYPGSVASYNTRPGNGVGLFYNAPENTRSIQYIKYCK